MGFIEIGAISVSVLTVVSSYFHQFRLFELTSHFRLQYLAASIILTLFFVVQKKRKLTLWFTLISIYNLSFILPWHISGTQNFKTTATLKILHANVFTQNRQCQKMIQLIHLENPDFIVTQEVNQRWISQLKVLESTYPFFKKLQRGDNFGLALYSKIPFESVVELTQSEFGIPTIAVTLEINKKLIQIIATHPLPPISEGYFNSRNRQLEFIADYCHNRKNRTILVGDLNTSIWSKYYDDLEKRSGLINTRKGFGILPSWPANFIPLRIPIDHCLVSKDIKVIKTKIGPNINSDHLPLIIELAF